LRERLAFARPTPVTAIALLQFGKAWLLMLAAVIAWMVPEALQAYGKVFSSVVYFASHGKHSPPFLLPIYGAYVAAMGWGLWQLRGWARRNLMATSGLTLAIWGRWFLFDQALGGPIRNATGEPAPTSAQIQAIGFLLLVDAIVFFYLFFDVDVKQAFGVKE